MLLKIYLASLAFGGVLLVASLVIGDDGDADTDFDGGADLDLDLAAEHGGAPDHGDIDALGGIFGALKSIRFWTFFTAFFGLTGTVFEGAGASGATVKVEMYRLGPSPRGHHCCPSHRAMKRAAMPPMRVK